MMVALGLHLALAILFFFILAWRAPNPPYPEYGIELNFGLDDAGAGNVQPATRPAPQPSPEPVVEEEIEESQPQEESTPDPEIEEEQIVESPAVQPEPSPVIEERAKPSKPAEKSVDQPKVEPTPRADEQVKNEKLAEPSKPVESEIKETGSDAGHGDDENVTGDKGSPEGSVDAQALYGSQGGGGGAALNLSGWNWDYIPKPEESSNETGRIVFRIQVDDRGEITNITRVEGNVSPAVERIYRQAVERLTFSPTSSGPVPPLSTGTITFTIRAK